MDIETPVDNMHEQLPQVRRVTKLDEIPRVVLPGTPRPVLLAVKKVITPQRPKSFFKYYLIGLIILGIMGLELAVIYRYDMLYRRFNDISISQRGELTALQYKLQHTNKIKSKLSVSRIGLINNYLEIGSQYKILQFRMNNYKENFKLLSIAKSSKINILEGDLRVAGARISAVNTQNELLTKKLSEKDESINELTSKLINNIGEQVELINENIYLKEESERLSKELNNLNKSINVTPSEDKNVNK